MLTPMQKGQYGRAMQEGHARFQFAGNAQADAVDTTMIWRSQGDRCDWMAGMCSGTEDYGGASRNYVVGDFISGRIGR